MLWFTKEVFLCVLTVSDSQRSYLWPQRVHFSKCSLSCASSRPSGLLRLLSFICQRHHSAGFCLPNDGLKLDYYFFILDISFVIYILSRTGLFLFVFLFVLEGGESCPNTYLVRAKLSGSLTHCPLALAHCPQCIKNDVVELNLKNIMKFDA